MSKIFPIISYDMEISRLEELHKEHDFSCVLIDVTANNNGILKDAEKEVQILIRLKPLIAKLHDLEIASIIQYSQSIANSVYADGLHIAPLSVNAHEILDNLQDNMMIGMEVTNSSHSNMQAMELEPDYIAVGNSYANSWYEAEEDRINWLHELSLIPVVAIHKTKTFENAQFMMYPIS